MSVEVCHYKNHPIQSSCYIVKDIEKQIVLIVDPGTEDMSSIFSDELGKNNNKIILTHEHFDHIMGCNDLNDKFSTPIICSDYCAEAIVDPKKNLSLFHNPPGFDVKNKISCIDNYNTSIMIKDINIEFYKAQGHSLGGICFKIGNYLFTGDSLIENTKTVTKLKNGSAKKLIETLELLESMKGNGYIVCPGHGNMFYLDDYDLTKALK